MVNLQESSGGASEDFCDTFYLRKPAWVKGSISRSDARFLFKQALTAGASTIVEIGTASGFSTAVLGHALNFASQAGDVAPDFQVLSYDISPTFYADRSRKVGDAARELLPAELLNHIAFRHPATASSLKEHHDGDSISFLFIDANHNHPWPALDLLACLDCLSPGAAVLLHDINLPIIHPEFASWGAKYLFDDLTVEKEHPQDAEMPNIGSIKIPADKAHLKAQLLEIISTHAWESKIPAEYLEKLGVSQ